MLLHVLVLFLCLCSISRAQQFVNHFEVLGVKEDAKEGEIKKRYRELAMTAHPDKAESGTDASKMADQWVLITEAYSVLKDAQRRAEFKDELEYFRKYGRLRWSYRYRIYPSTNVWIVIAGAILFTLGFQWWYMNWYHRRMQVAARMTNEYKTEVKRREKLGLEGDDIVIEVKGAEKPVWTDLWVVRLVLLPRTIYVWWKERPEKLRLQEEERRKWEEQWASMTNAEKKAMAIKAWRRNNR